MNNKYLLQKQNVIGYGYGRKEVNGEETSQLALSVFVTTKKPKEELRPKDIIPQSVCGLPTDVIETGEVKAFGINIGKVRPLIPGYSISHYRVTAGTLGAIVEHEGNQAILSNNHVIANSNNTSLNDPIIQPGVHDGGRETVAKLHSFQEIFISESRCPVARSIEGLMNYIAKLLGSSHKTKVYSDEALKPNKVDAAIALPLDNIDVNPHIKDIGVPQQPKVAMLDMPARKTGRTTDYTESKISQTNVTVKVMYPTGYALFEDQLGIKSSPSNPFGSPGDSGSLILNNLNPIALLFAGSDRITIANPIEAVMKTMEISF